MALEVEQLDAAVAVHVAAHHHLARRGVGVEVEVEVEVEVDVALAPAEVVLDAHGVVGNERLQDGRVGTLSDDSVAVPMVGKVERNVVAESQVLGCYSIT